MHRRMTSLFTRSLLAMTGSVMAFNAIAADSTTMSVVGQVTPVACDISTDMPVFDLGTILHSSLNQGTETGVSNSPNHMLRVVCPQPIFVSWHISDNSALTTIHSTDSETREMTDYEFSLGPIPGDDGVSLGSFQVAYATGAASNGSEQARIAYRDNSEGSWTGTYGGSHLVNSSRGWQEYSVSWNTGPGIAIQQVSDMSVLIRFTNIVIGAASKIPATQGVPLNGSATLSLVYL